MSHSFSPIVSPYLFEKRKKLVNLSGYDGQADKKICHVRKRICQHGANKNFRFKSQEQVGINYALCTRRKRDVKDKWTRIGNLYTNPQYIINSAEKISEKNSYIVTRFFCQTLKSFFKEKGERHHKQGF